MNFMATWRLWFLTVLVLFAVGYLLVQRTRKRYALRFASSELFDSVAPARPGIRRHIPAVFMLVGLAVLVVGFARPTAVRQVPRERATVIVAIDVSLSMRATDVVPTRLEAAQDAAVRFIDELPPTLNVGVVSFAGTAAVLVPPTQNHKLAQRAIENLELAESTAIGEAIFTSLDSLSTVPADAVGTPPPARIVLLSDGETTVGRPDYQAVEAALEADVPVSTIAFGTPHGSIIYDDPRTPAIEQDPINVPVRDDNLRSIADSTNGSFFAAASLDELEVVYSNIGSAIGTEEIDVEITDWFVGGALAVLVISSGFSLLWFQRLP